MAWEKGQSGNPKGRPKGSQNHLTILIGLTALVALPSWAHHNKPDYPGSEHAQILQLSSVPINRPVLDTEYDYRVRAVNGDATDVSLLRIVLLSRGTFPEQSNVPINYPGIASFWRHG